MKRAHRYERTQVFEQHWTTTETVLVQFVFGDPTFWHPTMWDKKLLIQVIAPLIRDEAWVGNTCEAIYCDTSQR